MVTVRDLFNYNEEGGRRRGGEGGGHHSSLMQRKRDLKMEKTRSLNDAWKDYLKT